MELSDQQQQQVQVDNRFGGRLGVGWTHRRFNLVRVFGREGYRDTKGMRNTAGNTARTFVFLLSCTQQDLLQTAYRSRWAILSEKKH